MQLDSLYDLFRGVFSGILHLLITSQVVGQVRVLETGCYKVHYRYTHYWNFFDKAKERCGIALGYGSSRRNYGNRAGEN